MRSRTTKSAESKQQEHPFHHLLHHLLLLSLVLLGLFRLLVLDLLLKLGL